MLALFQHQHAGAFADDKAVAAAVPGTRRRLRIVVARGQGTCSGKAAHAQRRDRGIGATGHHRVGIAVLDEPRRQPDAVQPRGAGRDHPQVGAGVAHADGHVPRDHVDDRTRDQERRDAARATLVVFLVVGFDHRQAADARAHQHAMAVRGLFVQDLAERQAGVGHGLQRSGDPVVHEGVDVPRLLGREHAFSAEVAHLAGDARVHG
jgi:hypothetical protein